MDLQKTLKFPDSMIITANNRGDIGYRIYYVVTLMFNSNNLISKSFLISNKLLLKTDFNSLNNDGSHNQTACTFTFHLSKLSDQCKYALVALWGIKLLK